MQKDRFILSSIEGLEISKRVTHKNGILVNDYADKFMPQMTVFKSKSNELLVEMDLIDTMNTTVEVEPEGIYVEGNRVCSYSAFEQRMVLRDDIHINTKQCGKFQSEIEPPSGFYFVP